MSKRKRNTRQLIAKILVPVFVLAVITFPIWQTSRWASGIVTNRDPRKVVSVEPFHMRTVDTHAADLKPFKQPIITITFDDGWESVYTNALPTLQKYGFHTTQYIITDTFDNHLYMSVAQLKSMQAAGHDIASHTVTHPDLTELSDSNLRYELEKSQQILNQDFNGPIIDFTSPYGSYNSHTLDFISQYYRSQKNAEGDPRAVNNQSVNTKSNFDPLNIESYSVRQSTSMNDLSELIKQAEATNGWLVLTYHQVDNRHEEYSVTPQVFQQQIQYLSQLNIRSATMNEVLSQVLPYKQDIKHGH